MPRRSKGARLWLRPARSRADGGVEHPVWIIRDGIHSQSTGCGAGEHREAEKHLAAYIAAKYAPERRERDIATIPLADVINIYVTDVAPTLARPAGVSERARRLEAWWGDKMLSEVTGATCRAYAAWREGKGPDVRGGRKGTGGGARRDLQDLSAAIGHHHSEGLHREIVRIVLPPRGEARQRWLTRDEAARLLWVCWRTRPDRDDVRAQKHYFPLRHLCRFLLFGLYTGSRPGAILRAAWLPGPTLSHIDLDNGVFHRRPDGAVETNKRQPTVRLAPRLKTHLRRWRRIDEAAGRAHLIMFDGAPVGSVKTALNRAVERAGLPGGVTAYTLRHSCASWLISQGVPTRKIAEFLGTSEKMIHDHYGHLAPDYQDEAAHAIGRKG